MTKQTEQKWRDRICDWRASGQTVDEFAADKSYEGSTLRWWSSRLGKTDASAAAAAPPRIVPMVVRVADETPVLMTGVTQATTSEVVVEVGGARVRVTRGFDDALLARVVRALAAEAS